MGGGGRVVVVRIVFARSNRCARQPASLHSLPRPLHETLTEIPTSIGNEHAVCDDVCTTDPDEMDLGKGTYSMLPAANSNLRACVLYIVSVRSI